MIKEKKELDNNVDTKFVELPHGFNEINKNDDNLMKNVASCDVPSTAMFNLDYSFIT